MTEQQSATKVKLAGPVVVDRRKKKKAPRALGDIAHTESHLAQAVRHTIKAADAGLAVYTKAQRKSRRKNGKRYIYDIIPNTVDGSAVMMRKLTVVPIDLMRAGYSPTTRKVVRRSLEVGARAASRLLLR